MAPLIIRCSKIRINSPFWQCCRFFHNKTTLQSNEKSLRKTFHKNEEVKKFRSYILTRYFEYIKNYEKVIENKFPTAMHLYRTFKVGMKEFYTDLKTYMKVIRILNQTTDGLKALSLNEIEIYRKMPRDMIKVAPVLLLSALPLTNYIIFPLAYFFPRQMLCSHFWTIQQRSEFQIHYLRSRLLYQRPTFRNMQAELETIKDSHLCTEWTDILGLIGSGSQPTTDQILECKDLFADTPYHIKYLKSTHVKNLLRIHGLHTHFWFRRSRLRDHAKLLRAMDRAIIREHGVRNLTQDALKTACFLRGFNPINMKHEDLQEWLDQWLTISEQTDSRNASLLLHCPILLGYNQPNNWLLIY